MLDPHKSVLTYYLFLNTSQLTRSFNIKNTFQDIYMGNGLVLGLVWIGVTNSNPNSEKVIFLSIKHLKWCFSGYSHRFHTVQRGCCIDCFNLQRNGNSDKMDLS